MYNSLFAKYLYRGNATYAAYCTDYVNLFYSYKRFIPKSGITPSSPLSTPGPDVTGGTDGAIFTITSMSPAVVHSCQLLSVVSLSFCYLMLPSCQQVGKAEFPYPAACSLSLTCTKPQRLHPPFITKCS